MKSLPIELIAETHKRFQQFPWIWLLEAEIPSDPPLAVRICNHTTTVEFDSDNVGTTKEYLPASFEFGEITTDLEGTLPSLPLSVGNVSRDILGASIDHNLLTGQDARLLLVNAATLDNALAKMDFALNVRFATVTETAITFNLSSYKLNAVQAPARRLQREFCDYDEYGGELCGFDIPGLDPGLATLGTCGRSEADCELRGDLEVAAGRPRLHPRRWGGCKGLPISGQ